MRYHAQENFIEAARFEQTGENVGLELKNLTEALRAAPTPQLRAEKALAPAEAWASQRGNLCLPLAEEGGDIFSSDLYESWRVRLQNAQTAGHTPEAASAEMEGWDEQRHAFAYYLRAADAWPGSPLAAHALWRANESLPSFAGIKQLNPAVGGNVPQKCSIPLWIVMKRNSLRAVIRPKCVSGERPFT